MWRCGVTRVDFTLPEADHNLATPCPNWCPNPARQWRRDQNQKRDGHDEQPYDAVARSRRHWPELARERRIATCTRLSQASFQRFEFGAHVRDLLRQFVGSEVRASRHTSSMLIASQIDFAWQLAFGGSAARSGSPGRDERSQLPPVTLDRVAARGPSLPRAAKQCQAPPQKDAEWYCVTLRSSIDASFVARSLPRATTKAVINYQP